MYKRKDFRINQKELEYILGNEWEFVKTKILTNCLCFKCEENKGNSTIVNYEIYIDYLNDVLFKGFCKKCNSKITRSIETGEDEKMCKRINEVVISNGKKMIG